MERQPQPPRIRETAAIPDQRSTAYRFVIAGLLVLFSLSFGFSFFAVSPITPLIMDEYGINRSAASLLTSLVFLTHVAFALPVTLLVGRVGLKKLIAVGWLLNSAPMLSFMVDSFPVLVALRVLYGAGFALVFPAVGPLLMQWFKPKELPLVNGIFIAVAGLGVTISTFIVVPIAEAIGWKTALSVFGGVSLFGAVCWLVLGRTERIMKQAGSQFSVGDVLRVLRSRNTLLLTAADAGPYALLTAALAWLPTFYHEVHGMSLVKTGGLMGLLSLMGVVSIVLASVLSLRVRRRRPFLIIPGVVAGSAGLGSFLLAGSAAVYIAILGLGFACWAYLPVLMTIPTELPGTNPNRVSVIFAAIMAVGGIFSFLSPLTVGAITDLSGSYIPGLALFAVLGWSLAISGVLLPETGTGGRESG